MDAHLSVIDDSDLSPIDKARASVLAQAYHDQWKNFTGEIVAVEKDFRLKFPNGWRYVGKIDLLLRDKQGLILVEHKTRSASDIRQLWDPYYQKLSFDAQLSGYHMAQWFMGEKIRKTVYDVVKKITTKPKRIPRGSEGAVGTRSEIEDLGTYYGTKAPQKAAETPLSQETAPLYKMRIAADVAEDPDRFFYQYSLVHRNEAQMVDYSKQLVALCRDMERAEETKAHYQNTSNCLSYGQKCEYFDLCQGVSYPEDTEKWQERGGSDLSGDRCISHSRATCFQSCRRKAYWRYNEKIEPIKPEAPALRFGKVFHSSLEAYWNERKEHAKRNS